MRRITDRTAIQAYIFSALTLILVSIIAAQPTQQPAGIGAPQDTVSGSVR